MYEQPNILPAHMFYSNALYFWGRYALWQEHNGSMPLVSYLASDNQRQGQVAASKDIFVQTTTAAMKITNTNNHTITKKFYVYVSK